MKRQRNTTCIYTGLVGNKMPMRKPRVSRRIVRRTVELTGGPLADTKVRLDADSGFHTLPIAAMKGFPSGRYINATWTPDEDLQDHVHQRGQLEAVR